MTAIGFFLLVACASALWVNEEDRLSYPDTLSNYGSGVLIGALAGYVMVIIGITVKLWEIMP